MHNPFARLEVEPTPAYVEERARRTVGVANVRILRIHVLGLLAWGAIVGAQQTEPPAGEAFAFDVSLGPGAVSRDGEDASEAYTAAWLAYALMRGSIYQELQTRGSGNRSADDFLIEYRAREMLANLWLESRESDEVEPDAYLDKLVEIADAGFLDEYVILVFAKPGWTVPLDYARDLDPAGFSDWWREHVAQLANPTHAIAEPRSAPLWPIEPGAELPDPTAFFPQIAPCSETLANCRTPFRFGAPRPNSSTVSRSQPPTLPTS
jgi:hypothetical protein